MDYRRLTPLSTKFNYTVLSFIVGRNWFIEEKTLTNCKALTKFYPIHLSTGRNQICNISGDI